MSRTVSISSVKKDFIKRVESSVALVKISKQNQSSRNGDGLKQKHVEQIMGLAFMSIIAAWEDFLEGCMVRYLKGRIVNPPNVVKSKLGELSGLDMAYKIIGGFSFERKKEYLKFSDLKSVKQMAEVYFIIHPFSPTDHEINLVKYMSIIRNRIAHNSEKARLEFNSVSKKFLNLEKSANLPQGWSVGVLLSRQPSTPVFTNSQVKNFKQAKISNNFEAFIFILKELANKFAPV